MNREMTKSEAGQEWRRLKGIVQPGRALVVGDNTLAAAAPKGFFVKQISDVSSIEHADDFELILLPFAPINPGDWAAALKAIHGSLSENGVLRILVYAQQSSLVSSMAEKPAPLFSRDELIDLLAQSGFSGISIDRRWFLRASHLRAKQTGGLAALSGVVPAWFEAMSGQGAILAAYAWK